MDRRFQERRNCRLSISAIILTFSCFLLAGCGDSPGSGKPRADFTITVTFDGEPVSEGEVVLVNEETGEGGGGKLAADGVATISAVALGSYTVLVQPPPPSTAPLPPAPGEPSAVMEMKEYPNIPEKFRSTATSPLTVEVTDGEDSAEFDLNE